MRNLLIAILLFAAPAFAQGGPPSQAGASHFAVSASAMGFSGGNTASAATIAGGSVALTRRFDLGYEQVIVPNLSANYYLGMIDYTVPLPALLGKKLNSKLVFNSSKWSTTFFAGAGVLKQELSTTVTDPVTGVAKTSMSQAQHIATTVGLGLNYVADSHITIQVVSGQWLHAGVAGPAGNSFIVTPNTSAISTGLKISF